MEQKCAFCEAPAVGFGKTKYGRPLQPMCQWHINVLNVKKLTVSLEEAEELEEPKTCKACGVLKQAKDFYTFRDTNTDKIRRRGVCKICFKEQKKCRKLKDVSSVDC